MSEIFLVLPEDFDNYAWEVTSKGCFSEARIIVEGRHYRLNFYDPVRLGQEIENAFNSGPAFFESNLIVIQSVTKLNMEWAANLLAQSEQIASLVSEE